MKNASGVTAESSIVTAITIGHRIARTGHHAPVALPGSGPGVGKSYGLWVHGGTLNGVTYDGTLDLSATGAVLTVVNGITVSTGGGAGVIDVTGASAELAFNDTQTLDHATVDLGNSVATSVLAFKADTGTAQDSRT